MMSTKNTTLIVAPGFYQNNAAFEKMIFANIVIDLCNKKHEKYDQMIKLEWTFIPEIAYINY